MIIHSILYAMLELLFSSLFSLARQCTLPPTPIYNYLKFVNNFNLDRCIEYSFIGVQGVKSRPRDLGRSTCVPLTQLAKALSRFCKFYSQRLAILLTFITLMEPFHRNCWYLRPAWRPRFSQSVVL